MTHSDRRRFLKGLLGALAQGAGSVVIAAAATSHAVANVTSGRDTDIRKRAEELATAAGASEGNLQAEFLNRAVRAGGGAFRNGGFRNW